MSIEASPENTIERLRRTLSGNPEVPYEELAGNRRAAAVLVPIRRQAEDLSLIYIRRSDDVASHRGQVAFPGGRVDPVDPSLLAAALREAWEEVSIEPASVDVLGAFSASRTLTSGMIVAPFVGVVPEESELRPNPAEVAEIFEVPLHALADPRYRGAYEWNRDGHRSSYPAILYSGQTIWGLTLRITLELLEMIEANDPD